jgi:hypothetical protein
VEGQAINPHALVSEMCAFLSGGFLGLWRKTFCIAANMHDVK